MNNCCKRIWFSILIIFSCISAHAIDLVVKAPSIVAVNQNFQITYTVEKHVKEFIRPVFTADFKVIAGPTKSIGKSIMQGVSSDYVSYTYYVRALKEGIFDIPVAEVKLEDGTTLKSKKTSIEVIKEDAQRQQQSPNNSGSQQTQNAADISPEDLFVKMEFNRTSVYKGEPIILTIKLYTHNVPVTSLTNFKMPTLAGFDHQELQVSANESSLHQEKYNNRVYLVAVIGRIMLYPLRAGEIKIDPIETGVSVQVQQQRRGNDLIDIIYGLPTRTVNKQLKSAPATIKIKDFPAGAPASFNGATGNYTITSSIDKTQTTANQPISYSVTISGTGNFKQINEPLTAFPSTFDKYDPKISNNVKTTNTGGTGNKKFEYVLIPRSAGEFEIPPVEFSYFDTQKDSYVTLKTKPEQLLIEKDPSGFSQPVATGTVPLVTGKKVEHLGNDILFIKTGPLLLKSSNTVFFGSPGFWLLFVALIIAFVLICLVMYKTAKNRQNVALMRNRKANKAARNRLKQSAKLLKEGDNSGFYEEVSRAVWGYIGDKLNMQGSELSRDNVQDKLIEQGVPQENIDLLLTVIDKCQYARYAPGSNRSGMEEMYNEAIKAISKLENLK